MSNPQINKHALSRTIDDPIKRAVRQRCGFGCIFCGDWIYEYEHFDPDFRDALTHDPEKICLLCPKHHRKVTSGRLTKDQVIQQNKNPLALSRGFVNDYLELSPRQIHVAMGRIFFYKSQVPLIVDEKPLLSIVPPNGEQPMMLNAFFYNSEGQLSMEIKQNELVGYTSNWDIEQEGTRTIIRRKKSHIVLQLNIIPPDVLEIEKIDMLYGSAEIKSDTEKGFIYMKAKNGALIDLPQGQILTSGITITETGITMNRSMVMGATRDIKLGKLNYRALIDNGRIVGGT